MTMTMSMCVTQCPADDAMAMCAIVRLRSCFDSTDVQLYNRVSCEDYIARFKEFRNKAILFKNCLYSRKDKTQSHCQQRFTSTALSPGNVT